MRSMTTFNGQELLDGTFEKICCSFKQELKVVLGKGGGFGVHAPCTKQDRPYAGDPYCSLRWVNHGKLYQREQKWF